MAPFQAQAVGGQARAGGGESRLLGILTRIAWRPSVDGRRGMSGLLCDSRWYQGRHQGARLRCHCRWNSSVRPLGKAIGSHPSTWSIQHEVRRKRSRHHLLCQAEDQSRQAQVRQHGLGCSEGNSKVARQCVCRTLTHNC